MEGQIGIPVSGRNDVLYSMITTIRRGCLVTFIHVCNAAIMRGCVTAHSQMHCCYYVHLHQFYLWLLHCKLIVSSSSLKLEYMLALYRFYVKIHFFYVKSNMLCKWSNILRKYYVTMFTPEHSLLKRSIPLRPPGPPSHPVSHPGPTWPSNACIPPGQPLHTASHLTRPTAQPSSPPHPSGLPSLTALPASSAMTVSRCASAVLVLLLWLYAS